MRALQVAYGQQAERLKKIGYMIEAIENRAMAVDGPVDPTYKHVTDDDLRYIYTLATGRKIR